MKIVHRIQMALHLGPQFILAEPGTDPLREPELFLRRRRKRNGSLLWWGLAALVLLATAWTLYGWWMRSHG
jgi:hypothetical protein